MAQAVRALPKRSEITPADTWDAASVFPSDAAWEAELTAIADQLPVITGYRGRLSEGPGALADWLTLANDVGSRVYKAYVYASLFHEADTTDQDAKAKVDRVMGLYARVAAASAFAEPELMAIGCATLRQWATDEPRLAIYAHYFDQLERRQAHVRSGEVEEVLGLATEPFEGASATHGILADADLTFHPARSATGEELTVAQGTIDALLMSADRAVRQTAWESYADGHLAFKNTMANCLATCVKQHVFTARVRGYDSSLEASLAPNFIPTDVFHNLIATFKENLPTWHRYWAIRQRALGYAEFHPYDIKAPLSQTKPHVPFDQGLEWIAAGLRPLGDEYVNTVLRGVREERWVDKYPNVGKRAGAFSSGCQGTHPFILCNSTDDLESMSTLAHELGHSMHSYLTWQTQPPVYADYTIFPAEVASNFNQALVRAYLLDKNPDPDFQIALIEEAMSNFHRYFFLMPTLARFELELHERVERGEALPAATMIGLMADLFREAYGPGVTLNDDQVGITWAQFPTHLYANFYVYQYATGISGAHALAQGVLAGTPGAVERYLNFLRAGSSVYPLDALREAGVDLTSPEPVRQAFGVLKGMVDRLERLLGQ
ncbi:MAG: oligoendopeptidase F [Thermomicrobiales bacterium]